MKKTETTGILTEHLRKLLKEKKIPANTKNNEFDLKNGRIKNKILELPEDFEIIAGSPHCLDFLTETDIRNSIYRLDTILSKILAWKPRPLNRLKCINKSQKRVFVVKKVKVIVESSTEQEFLLSKFSDEKTELNSSDMRERLEKLKDEYYFKKIKEGSNLRPNEWKFLLKHYEKYKKQHPFYLPLIKDKEYTWSDVKKELTHIENTSIESKSNEDKEYTEMWKIINTQSEKSDKKRSKSINQDIDKIDEKIRKYGFQIDRERFPRTREVKKIQ